MAQILLAFEGAMNFGGKFNEFDLPRDKIG
jgi:hypothetical protein